MEKDKSKIPSGPYCYTYEGDNFKICPYWDTVEGAPEQANGYCKFLEKSDIDLAKEAMESSDVVISDVNGKELDKEDIPDFIFMGLLWDQVKECGINDIWEDEFEDETDQ
jgi:hypothetical protein